MRCITLEWTKCDVTDGLGVRPLLRTCAGVARTLIQPALSCSELEEGKGEGGKRSKARIRIKELKAELWWRLWVWLR